ncbi:MAG: translation elongation factor-like protein [Candidatus Thorarchaeota archaeon]|nr:translation elongation factor-like protein [Candidatus Thorarchaeota archaeon]
MMERKIGEVTHYFTNIDVAAIELEDELNVGDTIRIKGHTTDFEQKIDSMEVDRDPVETGKPGQEIAIKVKNRVREHDEVFLVE